MTDHSKQTVSEAHRKAARELHDKECSCGLLVQDCKRETNEAAELLAEHFPSPAGTGEPLLEIADWLTSEAEKRMGDCESRRSKPGDRDATTAELKAVKKATERMTGRKLDLVKATREENIAYYDMQDRIADKLESEAKKLLIWAEAIRNAGARRTEPTVMLSKDAEAWYALPECEACGGTGKQNPAKLTDGTDSV